MKEHEHDMNDRDIQVEVEAMASLYTSNQGIQKQCLEGHSRLELRFEVFFPYIVSVHNYI